MIIIPIIIISYLLIGVLFAIPFVFFGAGKIDPAAAGGSFCFKLLIIPGSAALWPLLLKRWIRGGRPVEKSAHRCAAQC